MDSSLGVQVQAFLKGYLNARSAAGSELAVGEDLAIVRYRVPMGRPSELFCWGTRTKRLPLERGMWLTLIGADAASWPRDLPRSMQKLADEYLMEAMLPLGAEVAADIQVHELADASGAARRVAARPAAGAVHAAVAYFGAETNGTLAATARFGWADRGLVVVDQVLTQPAFRRRGMGEALMAAMSARAGALGAARMLLISSEEGRRLYERVGFRLLAPVAVYRQA
ncbi:MAG TPA: GNAT family N-acetyltransferase [Geminicoccus sp.]|uniref:GNAT family N-acetyltransferase n=1 Tax=Geminicoccus sp. TaxID=2024832 RepID=UPI002E34EEBB|nr:GNAT family N-acetyltransferase [Geminicoccus sp.]HEX2526989.1 GNAT family N-acetyltransferase [Geminicoccus sp.]